MTNANFDYASTSEEFSTIAEDQMGESVKEVADAQEAQENPQENKQDSEEGFSETNNDWETESRGG
jgi:hypothetical protein